MTNTEQCKCGNNGCAVRVARGLRPLCSDALRAETIAATKPVQAARFERRGIFGQRLARSGCVG